MAYSATASATQTHNRAKFKPHERNSIRVTKCHLDCPNGNIAATAQSVNVATIPAGALVLSVNIDVTTSEAADVGIDVGMDAGDEFADDLNVHTVAGQSVMLAPTHYCANTGKVTITTDGAGLANAIIDVYTTYIELDSVSAAN